MTLDECLSAFQDRGFQWLRDGRVVQNTSGGGYAASFTVADSLRELTQEEVFALSEEFFSIRDDVLAALTAQGSATDDETVLSNMLVDDRMRGVRSTLGDFSLIKFPATGAGNPTA